MSADGRLYEILGVNEYSTRADIVASYRKLAMEWHPDRNHAAGAENKFKEIQSAYRTLLQLHKPRSLSGLWEEVFGAEDAPAAEEEESGFWDNFPFLAAACLAAGGAVFVLAKWPGDWLVLTLAAAASGHMYKTGETRFAWRAESAFRLGLRLYFTGLAAWCVWELFWRVLGK